MFGKNSLCGYIPFFFKEHELLSTYNDLQCHVYFFDFKKLYFTVSESLGILLPQG